jgi:hypothetical protein
VSVDDLLARADWAVEQSEKGHDLRPLVAGLAAALREALAEKENTDG